MGLCTYSIMKVGPGISLSTRKLRIGNLRSHDIVRFEEHEISEAIGNSNEFKFRRMLHLGSMKGCPICKDIREKSLSQAREYRISINRGELVHAIATLLPMEDQQKERWQTDIRFSKLFDSVYPIEVRSHTKRRFIVIVRGDTESVGGRSKTEKDEWFKRVTEEVKNLNVEED